MPSSRMSELSLLSSVWQKSHFEAVRTTFDPAALWVRMRKARWPGNPLQLVRMTLLFWQDPVMRSPISVVSSTLEAAFLTVL